MLPLLERFPACAFSDTHNRRCQTAGSNVTSHTTHLFLCLPPTICAVEAIDIVKLDAIFMLIFILRPPLSSFLSSQSCECSISFNLFRW